MKWNELCIRIFFNYSDTRQFLACICKTLHISNTNISFTLYWKIKCLKIIVLCDFLLPATKNPFKALSLFPPSDTHTFVLCTDWYYPGYMTEPEDETPRKPSANLRGIPVEDMAWTTYLWRGKLHDLTFSGCHFSKPVGKGTRQSKSKAENLTW